MNDTPLTGASTWNLETLIGLPIVVLLVIVAIGIGLLVWRDDRGLASGAFGVGLAIAAVAAFGWFPYDAQYHKIWTVHGTVTAVDKRLISDGSAMSERFVVEIAGQPFGVDDTRAATLTVGDTVTLGCTRSWVYASEDGWVCRWQGGAR